MLSRESALELATSSANSKGLAIVVLPFSGGEEGDVQTRFAMGHMVYSRAGGFLLIFPAEEELRDVLLALEPPEGSDAPAIFCMRSRHGDSPGADLWGQLKAIWSTFPTS